MPALVLLLACPSACTHAPALAGTRPVAVSSSVTADVSALRAARLRLAFPHAQQVEQRPLVGGDSGADVQRVDVDGVAYVYKAVPLLGEAEAVARARREVAVTQWAADRGLAPRVAYADVEAGFFVSAYFDAPPQSWQDGGREPKLSATLHLLRRLHDEGAQGPAAPLGRPLDEARALRALARVQDEARADPALLRAVALLPPLGALLAAASAPPVRCHGDVHPDNVLYRPDATVLIDWEWTHVGDAMFELATLADQIDLPVADFETFLGTYGAHAAQDALRFCRYLLLRTAVRTLEDFVDTPWHMADSPDRPARLRRHVQRLDALTPAARLQDPV